jgi:radical SAM superfamily enzyme YgiQ (UPF0313 family)
MSGVRIKNDALCALGMTLPGFIERGKVIASLPSLGLLTLAALTPEHWLLDYREIDDEDPGGLLDERYDLVAISTLAARASDAYRIADRFRERGVPVVIGGLHASALPDEALLHADAVVKGEGESVWPQLLEDLEDGRMGGIYQSPPFRLQDAPLPRYDLLELERYNRLTLQTTRGCPLDCSFCAASRTISAFKRKPLELVRRDLEAILALWPKPFLELADDNTFVHKRWSKDLARLFGEYDVRWFTETDISLADDDELLELLAVSGCAQVLIGLESVEMRSLKTVDSKGWKARQGESYLRKIEKIQSYGISVNGCFVLGLDEDDDCVFQRTRDFVRASKLSEVQITVMTPFPGTRLFEELKAAGRLFKEEFWDECTLFDVVYKPARMSADDLRAGFMELAGDLYSEEETAHRRANFVSCRRSALRKRQENQ